MNRSSIEDILLFARQRKVEVRSVPIEKLNKLSKSKNHQGFVAVVQQFSYFTIEEMIASLQTPSKPQAVVVLDSITDVRNFGAIARSAFFFGIENMIIPNSSSVSISKDAIQASAGALNKMKVAKVNSIIKSLDEFRMLDYRVVAFQGISKAQNVLSYTCPKKIVIILGSESKGIHPSILKYADDIVMIPNIKNNFDSINVSVVSGIAFYEYFKQHEI